MIKIGQFTFPETREEANQWRPFQRTRALATRVLVVAKTRVEGKWAAYCGAVPGICHDDEKAEVLKSGDKIDEALARHLFPEFLDVPYAR